MSLKLRTYLKELRQEAHRLERTDINNRVDDSFLGRNRRRIICMLPSLLLVICLKTGFNDLFVNYASTALSILIGLFTTAIIFILDKYRPADTQNQNSRQKLQDTQAFNYTKQFSYITGYNIVLCVFTLVLLSLSALFPNIFGINIFEYEFIFKEISCIHIYNLIIALLIVIQRLMILYWLSNIIYNTLYAISSLVKYAVVNIERQ